MQPHREGVFKVCPHPGLNYSFFSYMYDFASRNGLHKILKQTQEQGQEQENKDHMSEGTQPKDRNAAGQLSIEDLKEEEQMTKYLVPNPTTENERSGISGGPKVRERSTAAAGAQFSIEDLKEEEQLTSYFISNLTTENERSGISGGPKVKERSTAAARSIFN